MTAQSAMEAKAMKVEEDTSGKSPFYLDEYIDSLQFKSPAARHKRLHQPVHSRMEQFQTLCRKAFEYFHQEWEMEAGRSREATERLLLHQKNAIIGYAKEVSFFKGKIQEYLKKNTLAGDWYPAWYPDLVTAVFHENWGIAGLYAWTNMQRSSSAKIIGERIYFLINGKQELQEQTIARERLNQLRTALLLRTPEIRMDERYAELYMLDGTRITLYDEGLAKEPIIVFRKYIVQLYSFEEQARLGTIPYELIPLLEAKVAIGYNVGFVGPVRTAKTTFLTTWQSYEDPSLEGIQVETDPEIPLHLIMPKAPIMQLVADGSKLKKMIKPLMRSDGDYMIMAEARDAYALKIALDVTKKGTRRVKLTFHTSDPADFCYDAACEIVQEFGGDLWATTIQFAKGYHYLYELCQLPDKSKKRLKGIYEIRYNPLDLEITIHQICKYDFALDEWRYRYDIGADKEALALEENHAAFQTFRAELSRLASGKPMEGRHVTVLPYLNLLRSPKGG